MNNNVYIREHMLKSEQKSEFIYYDLFVPLHILDICSLLVFFCRFSLFSIFIGFKMFT